MRSSDKLRAFWKDNDSSGWSPLGYGTSSDARYLLCEVLTNDVYKELESRGYDISTLRFSIEPQKGNTKFRSQRQDDCNCTDGPCKCAALGIDTTTTCREGK
jgi:hypothetical protein